MAPTDPSQPQSIRLDPADWPERLRPDVETVNRLVDSQDPADMAEWRAAFGRLFDDWSSWFRQYTYRRAAELGQLRRRMVRSIEGGKRWDEEYGFSRKDLARMARGEIDIRGREIKGPAGP